MTQAWQYQARPDTLIIMLSVVQIIGQQRERAEAPANGRPCSVVLPAEERLRDELSPRGQA
jgi:hypothetical protein